MTDILFSSWGGKITDNRGKPEGEQQAISGLNLPAEFDQEHKIKAFFGWDGIAIRAPEVNVVDMVRAYLEAVQNESCGKCTPCREGTRWVVQILERIEAGAGTVSDLKKIEQICNSFAANSFCPLAVGAAPPIISAILEFKDEFVAYIQKNPDANRNPKMKMAYPYQVSVQPA